MPSVSKCPKCQQPVTIPDQVGPEVEVRCPLCAVVYPLGEALAGLPPALVPVDSGAIQGPATASDSLLKSDLVSEPYYVPGAVNAAGSPQPGSELGTHQQPGLDVWQKVDAVPQIDTGSAEGDMPARDAGTFAIIEEQPSEDEYEPARGRRPQKQRKTKHKSALRLLLEAVAGGLLGLTIGYYALCWLGPSSLDLPKLPLPLLPHTIHAPPGPKDDTVLRTLRVRECGRRSVPPTFVRRCT